VAAVHRSRGLRTASGPRLRTKGERQMANGEWRKANSKWRKVVDFVGIVFIMNCNSHSFEPAVHECFREYTNSRAEARTFCYLDCKRVFSLCQVRPCEPV
jgi:hypothetical protein